MRNLGVKFLDSFLSLIHHKLYLFIKFNFLLITVGMDAIEFVADEKSLNFYCLWVLLFFELENCLLILTFINKGFHFLSNLFIFGSSFQKLLVFAEVILKSWIYLRFKDGFFFFKLLNLIVLLVKLFSLFLDLKSFFLSNTLFSCENGVLKFFFVFSALLSRFLSLATFTFHSFSIFFVQVKSSRLSSQ